MKIRRLQLGILLTMLCLNSASHAESPLQPDPQLTPGEALTTDAAQICTPGYAKSVRDVPSATKRMVYHLYGIENRQPGEYEIDHLISLELGGSNSIRNLWPQSFTTHPLNAHLKDALENKLHELICSGQLPVHEAQAAIAGNWVKAYEQFLGPLPNAQSATPAPASTPQPAAPAIEEEHPTLIGNCPAEAPVKVSRRGIYHLPSDSNYALTRAVHCLSSAAAAQANGFRPPKPHER